MEKAKALDSSYHNLIRFVPSKGLDQLQYGRKSSAKVSPVSKLSGKEARKFYEALVEGESSDCITSQINKADSDTYRQSESHGKKLRTRSRKTKSYLPKDDDNTREGSGSASSFISQRKYFKLLQSAQDGETESLSSQLDTGLNINHQDFYGWTALMCAAHAGHMSAVEVCLNHGATTTLLNNSGQSAAALAKSSGFRDIADKISRFGQNRQSDRHNECQSSSSSLSDTFTCEICRQEFSVSEKVSHSTSTVHLFNLGYKAATTSFLIPETNRGFQMLVRRGWDGDCGLGPHGRGQKYPVKTVLKRDRSGFGAETTDRNQNAKITHFSAKDKRAVEHVSKISRVSRRSVAKNAKMITKAKAKRDKRQEINIRREFSDYN